MLNLNCVICAELFAPSDDVHVTNCGHMFHYTCLIQWMERSKTCPQCRNKCTTRNIFRIYFNLANLNESRVDIGSLQEQIDNLKLQAQVKNRELKVAEEEVKVLKDTRKKCLKTIKNLEQQIKSNDFLIQSYVEQMKLVKTDQKVVDGLRNEVNSLKKQIETMDGVAALITACGSEADKIVKQENDPKKLALWITVLKRELRTCDQKKTDMRNMLKLVQTEARSEMKLKKEHEERISQLESENYQLVEKIKLLEVSNETSNHKTMADLDELNKAFKSSLLREERRTTISPSIKESVKNIEESNSPYLNIKKSIVGLSHFGQRLNEVSSTNKLTTLKISPKKRGLPFATTSDLSDRYSTIFKKPRIGQITIGKPIVISDNADLETFEGNSNPSKVEKLPNQHVNMRLKTGALRNIKLSK
ncbi:E3 ubiquitin-protein ligase TRAIP-like [Teleopsis dalmanni]|uniref:E3 ubiquitin-protein ligase TRAIP-like n=1 Tax=Teleopsis dalmanni TaxID=139649 RepID=UPI0018CF5FCD|nr:E3 ubiquitin-protein ligase TRAIP-like [Teleopsis dalmanni]XP_037956961.1 E3 ubiquitin-protein ligase TRAIP-like [Teleopsis dalmanni]